MKREKGGKQSQPLKCASSKFTVSEGEVRGGVCSEANASRVTNEK